MAWIFNSVSLLVFISFNCYAETVVTKSFDAVIGEVLQSPEFQATQSTLDAVQFDFDAREIVLEPYMELEGKRVTEHRQLFTTANSSTVQTSQKPVIDSVALTLTKPFSTGTLVKVGPRWENALITGTSPDHRYTADWYVSISQSLWKDFFGRSTSLRRKRESFERKQQLATALNTRGQVLVDFENLYWDWALALRQQEIQEKNLGRSKQILRWVQDRFNRSAAESTDLLQARALLTQREVQLSVLQLSLTQAYARVERYLRAGFWKPDPNDLSKNRSADSLVQAWRAEALSDVTQLQFLQAQNEAMASEQKALEERETIRPEVNLNLSYGRNAIDTTSNPAVSRAFNEDHNYSTVGVVFRTGLDLGSERKKVDAARSYSQAANQRRDARQSENKVAWQQLKQQIKDLEDRAVSAQQLVELQFKKADAQRDRYRKGRATAFEAITFEQDASDAEVTLWQLYALMRKTEAQARLFAR